MQAQERPESPASIDTATPLIFDLPGIGFKQPGEFAFIVSHEGKLSP
jgi:hypothetical protein